MSYSEICPQPVRRAVMKQGWYDLAYIHFRYSVDEVARILPDGLEVDVCDGSAWVGLIPFSMRGIGVPGLPAVPYFGSFAEINVRTYVRRNGVPGVWFCSLDINRLLPTIVARTTYTLPYCFGRASNKRVDDELHTMVERRWP
ncbi:MAG: YqjF family protein, partial [Acidimicrobiaceae bacterium]